MSLWKFSSTLSDLSTTYKRGESSGKFLKRPSGDRGCELDPVSSTDTFKLSTCGKTKGERDLLPKPLRHLSQSIVVMYADELAGCDQTRKAH